MREKGGGRVEETTHKELFRQSLTHYFSSKSASCDASNDARVGDGYRRMDGWLAGYAPNCGRFGYVVRLHGEQRHRRAATKSSRKVHRHTANRCIGPGPL